MSQQTSFSIYQILCKATNNSRLELRHDLYTHNDVFTPCEKFAKKPVLVVNVYLHLYEITNVI